VKALQLVECRRARAVNEILDDLDRFAAPTRSVIEWS